MILETERLVLRLPRPSDADAVAEMLGEEEVTRFLGGTAPRDAAPAIIEKWRSRWAANGVGPFVVEHDGRFVGRVGINVWDTRTWTLAMLADAGEHAQPELGWALTRAAWGHGYATEAARALLRWAPFDSLVSLIAPANVPTHSCR